MFCFTWMPGGQKFGHYIRLKYFRCFILIGSVPLWTLPAIQTIIFLVFLYTCTFRQSWLSFDCLEFACWNFLQVMILQVHYWKKKRLAKAKKERNIASFNESVRAKTQLHLQNDRYFSIVYERAEAVGNFTGLIEKNGVIIAWGWEFHD